MPKIITTDTNGNIQNFNNVNDEVLNGYGTQFTNITVEDEKPGTVPMENGIRFTFDDPLNIGKWLCVQGLWVYFEPNGKNKMYNLRNDFYFDDDTEKQKSSYNILKMRYYNKFQLKNFQYTYMEFTKNSETGIITYDEDKIHIEENSQFEETFSTVIQRDSWSPDGRQKMVICQSNGSQVSSGGVLSMGNKKIGILLVGVDYSWVQSNKYPYGYIEISPALFGGNFNDDNYVDFSQVSYGYKNGYIENSSSQNGPIGFPICYTLQHKKNDDTMWGFSWVVPMANENELLYNQGITDKYTTMSYEELEALKPEDDNNE